MIVLAIVACYANSLRAPFIFDDRHSVVENETIRRLATAWSPPPDTGAGVRGRPLVNFSLALNYAVGGLDVRGYHVANILIHVANALLLYGLLRRTFGESRLQQRFDGGAETLALTATLLWALHPLLTETVTCVAQRTESLGSFFYLLTLYCFVRGAAPNGSVRWLAGAVAACLAGVTAKEIIATAPLLVFLYDAVFVSDGFADAWRRRRIFFLTLAATWLPLGALVMGASGRGGTVGFGFGMEWWQYALTQCEAIVRYLKLGLWPHPLVLDYGVDVVKTFSAVWWQALLLLLLIGATALGLRRRSAAGFFGAWFFLILAPSSSVLPLTTQTIAEHRMYLPLAALAVLVVAGTQLWLGRRSEAVWWLAAVALATLTIRRNADYRSEVSIWADTVERRPENPRAHYNLAVALLAAERPADAEMELRAALRLAPNYTDAHINLGQLLVNRRRPAEAVDELEQAVRLRPDSFAAQLNFATALAATGRATDALEHYSVAARMQPRSAVAQFGLGSTLAALGRVAEAIAPFESAVGLQPENAAMRTNLASALAVLGRTTEAKAQFEMALRYAPDSAETHFNYGLLLAQTGDPRGALEQWEQTLRLKPDHEPARLSRERLRAYLQKEATGP